MVNKQYNHEILISVVVPFFNIDHELFLKCLDSILQQTYKNIEIIVIDDGSKGSSATFLDEISKKDERIYVYHQENKGVSEARNYGVSLSKGKYLTFIDADDAIVPYFLEEALEIIEKEKADEVLGANLKVDDLDENVKKIENPICHTLSGNDRFEFRPHLLGEIYYIGDSKAYIGRGPVAKLLKTETIKNLNFDPGLILCEDNIWNLKFLNSCYKICYVEQIWYKYFQNIDSVSHKYTPLMIQWCEESLCQIPNCIDINNDAEYRAYVLYLLEKLYLFAYKNYLFHKDKINKNERKKTIKKIYTTLPWVEIGSKRFLSLSSKKNKIKAILFRFRLLIWYWDIKEKTRSKC